MTQQIPEPDPLSRFEDEGIPDLQDGTPQQQRAVDPQEAPLPGDRPVAVDDFGTTVEEQIEGEPLDGRLAREEPEEEPVFGVPEEAPRAAEPETEDEEPELSPDGGLGVGSELDTRRLVEPQDQVVEADGHQAGRLVEPADGSPEAADDAGADMGGYTAEESAMRIEPE
jgi:hypothetical protein